MARSYRAAAQPAAEREVGEQPRSPGARGATMTSLRCGLPDDDRRGGGFDDIGEVRVGKPLAQRANGRRREDDVADLAQPDQQNRNYD